MWVQKVKGHFRILLNNVIEIYTDTDELPDEFDNLIEFAPEYPEGPHTDEEHEIMHRMDDVLHELLKREIR